MRASLRLCHLSDPHIGGHVGAEAVLDFLVGHALERGADHVLVTGDLVDRPESGSLSRVVAIFKRHGLWHPRRATLLPGNHDVSGLPDDPAFGHTPAMRRAALHRFATATAHVNRPVPGPGARLFAGRPVFKRLGPVRLLALSTAALDHPVAGRILPADLAVLDRTFARPKRGFRIVAVHHHPYPLKVGHDPALGRFVPEGLAGGGALLEACGRAEVDLVLHGHLHTAGRQTDRRIAGVRVRCQGTARGETRGGRRRFGYDLWELGPGGMRKRSFFFGSGAIVDGLLERTLSDVD
jgi:3',5'-cyclic AMP phosphodiesterase CpdA